jgi:hypothetical protein
VSYHKDKEVNHSIVELLDALCQWERNTGRRSTLILIPHTSDETIVLAQDGKPLTRLISDEHPAKYILDLALKERGKVDGE